MHAHFKKNMGDGSLRYIKDGTLIPETGRFCEQFPN